MISVGTQITLDSRSMSMNGSNQPVGKRENKKQTQREEQNNHTISLFTNITSTPRCRFLFLRKSVCGLHGSGESLHNRHSLLLFVLRNKKMLVIHGQARLHTRSRPYFIFLRYRPSSWNPALLVASQGAKPMNEVTQTAKLTDPYTCALSWEYLVPRAAPHWLYLSSHHLAPPKCAFNTTRFQN